MSQKQNVIISDIHMGINIPTNWYQKDIHEPYLAYILQWVLDHKDEVDEFIILGDLFDFWTYPPDVKPASAADIVNANPNILGPDGLVSKVLDALDGRVSYLHGNHDITTTQEDLNSIGNSMYKVKLQNDIYMKDGVLYTHGHLYTLFNAPDISNPPQPLPVGHFVTRAVSYMLQQKGESASHEAGFGASDMGFGGLAGILKDGWSLMKDHSVVDALLQSVQNSTEITDETTIVLERDLGTITFGEVKTIYKNLFTTWIDKYNLNEGDERGGLYAYKATYADFNGTYLAWFAQQLAFEYNAKLVVMGHTHIPKAGMQANITDYINTGFECVPIPDMPSNRMTFGLVTTENGSPVDRKVMAVLQDGNGYTTVDDNPPKADFLGPGSDAFDFSCYITVENNSNEDYALVDGSLQNIHGFFFALPPTTIAANSSVQFWIQDAPGLEGSEGKVSYKGKNSGTKIDLLFKCPTLFEKNGASGTNDFYTKSVKIENAWEHNSVVGSGHPFFVKFII